MEEQILVETMKKRREAYFNAIRAGVQADEAFALDGDEPLSEEERAAVDAFWGRFASVYPEIDYRSFQSFKNRLGRFDARHIPGGFYAGVLFSIFTDRFYGVGFRNKALLPCLYPDIRHPKPLASQVNQIFLDGESALSSREAAIATVCAYLEKDPQRRVFIKPAIRPGSRRCVMLGADSRAADVEAVFQKMGGIAFVAQEEVAQSDFTARFHPGHVNTLCVSSLFFEGQIYPLAALLRIGNAETPQAVDASGGVLLGVDVQTGVCNDWALTEKLSRVTTLGSVDLRAEKLVVPKFDRILHTVRRMHSKIPYVKLITFEMALDAEDEAVLLECHFHALVRQHEAVTGPIFGEMTERVLSAAADAARKKYEDILN